MTSVNRAVVGFAVVLATGCTLGTPSIPALSGPSAMSMSLVVTASRDLMARDGTAQSTITVTARDANAQPVQNLQLRMDVRVGGTVGDLGTLSARTVSTGNDGSASVIYTAPPAAAFGAPNEATIQVVATPIGTDASNGTSSAVSIRLVSPGVIQPPNGAPVPSFFVSPTSPHERESVLFDGSASKDPDGKILTYAWNFGDGDTAPAASSPTVTHHYDLAAIYQATLTVTDDRGLSVTSAPMAITVSAATNPVASFLFSPTAPVVGDTIFFNGSASSVPTGRQIVSWQWDFGDGSPARITTTATTSYVYPSLVVPKTYVVVLTVTDDIGRTGTASLAVTVGAAANPVASFIYSPTDPKVGDTVVFNAAASTVGSGRRIVSWKWDFGDGTATGTQTTTTATTSYGFPLLVARTYTVVLTVTDDLGRTGTFSATIKINP